MIKQRSNTKKLLIGNVSPFKQDSKKKSIIESKEQNNLKLILHLHVIFYLLQNSSISSQSLKSFEMLKKTKKILNQLSFPYAHTCKYIETWHVNIL